MLLSRLRILPHTLSAYPKVGYMHARLSLNHHNSRSFSADTVAHLP